MSSSFQPSTASHRTLLAPIWSTKSQHQHSPIPYNLKSCILKYKASTAACTGWDACGQVSCEEQYVCSTCGQASPSLAADTFWTMHDRATDSNNLQHQGHVLLHTLTASNNQLLIILC
ncbi:hypothetical protein E2C01_095925 [Portunus trituberculatus]|uniref:Uncharacterized protein n=1 Tax=Portunus trituberculatus TaxID=210409 RepID=A0A5B7JR50_PORTR|nr:hypothetical protein [Portunus trituberculatus]